MSPNRLQHSIKELDKDITDCENFLTKVLKRKIERPKISSGSKPKQNGTRDRTAKPFLTGPTSKSHSFPAGLKERNQLPNKSRGERLLHKEYIENKGGTVEVTVKTKSGGRNSKRSRSSSRARVNKDDNKLLTKSTEDSKQPNSALLLPSTATSTRVSPKQKHLSWSEVLKDNICTKQDDYSSNSKSNTRVRAENRSHSSKPKTKSRCDLFEEYSRKFLNVVESKHPPSTASSYSEQSSGFSSTADENVECVNKSIQCLMPQTRSLQVDSTTTLSSNIADESRVKMTRSTVVDAFSMFNPVRTLNFLIKELQGIIKKNPEDQNLQRIVTDMEKALDRIPPELQSVDSCVSGMIENAVLLMQNSDISKFNGFKSNNNVETNPVFLKTSDPGNKKTFTVQESIAKTLASVPVLALKADSSGAFNLDASRTSLSIPSVRLRSDTSALLLQKQLEDSCAKLEAMCQQMEATCKKLREERDQLEEDVKQKNRDLDAMAAKEQDYLTTITSLRLNLESSGTAMAELRTLTAQLREEVKTLPTMRVAQSKLNEQLHTSYKETEKVSKELQLLQLEREKLLMLNKSKDTEIERFRKEITDIKTMVIDELNTLKTVKESAVQGHSAYSMVMSNNDDTDADSIPSDIMQIVVSPRHPACSSPTSSRSSSFKVDKSWQRISSICRPNTEPEVLILSPVKEKGSSSTVAFQSIDLDSVVELSSVTEIEKSETNLLLATVSLPTRSKPTQELKSELKNLFNEMKKQSFMSTNISIPSPPHPFDGIEPSGLSQWSGSASNSAVPSVCVSISDAEETIIHNS